MSGKVREDFAEEVMFKMSLEEDKSYLRRDYI